MNLCKNCISEIEQGKSKSASFPSCTIVGGIAGGIAALFTGPLLVPVGVLGGITLDLIRCERCGSTENVQGHQAEYRTETGEIYLRTIHNFTEEPEQCNQEESSEDFSSIQTVYDFSEWETFRVVPDCQDDYSANVDTGDPSLQADPTASFSTDHSEGAPDSGSGDLFGSGGPESGGGES